MLTEMPIAEAVSWVAGGAVIGGGLGAVGSALNNNSAVLHAVENGAGIGVGLVSVGALVVALANSRAREEALETAGIGFGALILGGIASHLTTKA
jgi:hypothetical protein